MSLPQYSNSLPADALQPLDVAATTRLRPGETVGVGFTFDSKHGWRWIRGTVRSASLSGVTVETEHGTDDYIPLQGDDIARWVEPLDLDTETERLAVALLDCGIARNRSDASARAWRIRRMLVTLADTVGDPATFRARVASALSAMTEGLR